MTIYLKIKEEPITYLYEVIQGFVFKNDLLIYVFTGELFFYLGYIIITISYDHTGSLICFFNDYISIIY